MSPRDRDGKEETDEDSHLISNENWGDAVHRGTYSVGREARRREGDRLDLE